MAVKDNQNHLRKKSCKGEIGAKRIPVQVSPLQKKLLKSVNSKKLNWNKVLNTINKIRDSQENNK